MKKGRHPNLSPDGGKQGVEGGAMTEAGTGVGL